MLQKRVIVECSFEAIFLKMFYSKLNPKQKIALRIMGLDLKQTKNSYVTGLSVVRVVKFNKC